MLQFTFALFVLGVPFLRWRRYRKDCTRRAWAFVKEAEDYWDKCRCPGCHSIDIGFIETRWEHKTLSGGRIRNDGERDRRYTASSESFSWKEDVLQCRKCMRKFELRRGGLGIDGRPEDPQWHPSGFASPITQDGKEVPSRSGRKGVMKRVRKAYWQQEAYKRPSLIGGAMKGAFLWVIAAVVWAVVMK